MTVLCTLFDSNYLDKGLVMFESLQKQGIPFRLYVLAMDDKCHEVLSAKACAELIPIELSAFLVPQLRAVMETRSRAEFCWTCTSFLIDHVLSRYREAVCTYVDADLFFYGDPAVLLAEMGDKTVQIVAHRFTDSLTDRERRKRSGTYCVQFNTFRNTEDALKLLRTWEAQCIESCSIAQDYSVFGDQGYLEKWGEYPNVSVLQNPGGGVAPWNAAQYRLVSAASQILLEDKKSGFRFPLVFYHYHNLKYHSANEVDIGVFSYNWGADEKLIRAIYPAYLQALDRMKERLRAEFGVYPLVKTHPGLSSGEPHGSRLQKLIELMKAGEFNKIFIKLDAEVRARVYRKKDIFRI